MDTTEGLTAYHNKITSDFLYDAITVCRKEDKSTFDLIELLHAQAQMCQTMVFCFMATHLKDKHVAAFYGEITKMSQEAADRLVDHPEVLLQYAKQIPGEITPALLATIKLLGELKASKKGP